MLPEVTEMGSPALFLRTRPLALSPETEPPTVYVFSAQRTPTLVTLAVTLVAEALLTVQVWPVGWVPTVTLYCPP